MSKCHTVLIAEDGTYYKNHDSYEAAKEYRDYQMGDEKELLYGGIYMDVYGRKIYIEEGHTSDTYKQER